MSIDGPDVRIFPSPPGCEHLPVRMRFLAQSKAYLKIDIADYLLFVLDNGHKLAGAHGRANRQDAAIRRQLHIRQPSLPVLLWHRPLPLQHLQHILNVTSPFDL
jgi:hypothetical protein